MPAILYELDVSTGYRAAGFMDRLHDILGQGNPGTATLSWSFTPVNPPPDLQAQAAAAPALPAGASSDRANR